MYVISVEREKCPKMIRFLMDVHCPASVQYEPEVANVINSEILPYPALLPKNCPTQW